MNCNLCLFFFDVVIDHKSRQVVLDLRVYEVVADVNFVNFHRPKEAPLALPLAIGPPMILVQVF
jgi:hypothetical protein